MNAINFIQLHGVDKARKIINGQKDTVAPNLFKYFSPAIDDYHMMNIESNVRIEDLKRLVKSVELVEVCGGLVEAKKKMNSESLRSAMIEHVLYKAIADYEAIGGEHV
jgi:hypothetical protein